jgi:NRAMP (natural resistance-associated macrophage protein)-like metal ion transporter
MKNLTKIGLGILTSIGGYLEVGSMGTAIQAGSAFRYELLWAIAIGTVCIAFLVEMTGRLAAVSHHTVVEAVRKRFGIRVQVWPLLCQVLVDLLVLASEIGGASLALELTTGVSIRVWVVPVAVLVWALLWFATFGAIEHSVAVLGLVTLSFSAAAWWLGPDWHAVGRGLLPHRPPRDTAQYLYFAVGILGATISPYLFSFYSSGAVEEQWREADLMPNRIVAALGMGFGSLVAMSVMIVGAIVLAPRGIEVEMYQQAATMLSLPFPKWGFSLFCASLFIGCVGAALEIALDASYIFGQTFGWEWSENQRPGEEARFAVGYTMAVLVATTPSLLGVDPLKFTMFSMAVTVVVLPVLIGPLLVVMNDGQYLKQYTNGWIANVAVCTIIGLGFVLALIAIPLQLMAQ